MMLKKFLSLSLIGCLSLSVMTMGANAVNTDESNNSVVSSAINSDISEEISVENDATLQEKLSTLKLDKLSNEEYQSVMETAPTAYKSLETAQSEQEKEEILNARKAIIYTQSWCRDGFPRTGVYHGDTGEITWTHYFHEIFPQDWEIPDLETSVTDETLSTPYSSDATTFDELVRQYQNATIYKYNESVKAPNFGEYNPGFKAGYYSLTLSSPSVLRDKTWNAGYSKSTIDMGSQMDLTAYDGYIMQMEHATEEQYGHLFRDNPVRVNAMIAYGKNTQMNWTQLTRNMLEAAANGSYYDEKGHASEALKNKALAELEACMSEFLEHMNGIKKGVHQV